MMQNYVHYVGELRELKTYIGKWASRDRQASP